MDDKPLIALAALVTAMVAVIPAFSALIQSRANARRLDAETEATARKSELTDLRDEINRLSARVADQEKEISALRAERTQMSDEIIRLRDRLAVQERDIGRLTAERDSLKERVKELERKVGDVAPER